MLAIRQYTLSPLSPSCLEIVFRVYAFFRNNFFSTFQLLFLIWRKTVRFFYLAKNAFGREAILSFGLMFYSKLINSSEWNILLHPLSIDCNYLKCLPDFVHLKNNRYEIFFVQLDIFHFVQ